jgi:hypothetical protein
LRRCGRIDCGWTVSPQNSLVWVETGLHVAKHDDGWYCALTVGKRYRINANVTVIRLANEIDGDEFSCISTLINILQFLKREKFK